MARGAGENKSSASSAPKTPEEIAEKKSAKAEDKGLEPVPDTSIETERRKDEEQTAGAQKPTGNAKPEERKDVAATNARDESKQALDAKRGPRSTSLRIRAVDSPFI